MTIDARIPLLVNQPTFNLPEIMLQAERVKSMRAEREAMQQKAERENNARSSLADLILSQSSGQAPWAAGQPTQDPNPSARGLPGAEAERQANAYPAAAGMPGAAQPSGPSAWEQYVRYDPQGAIDLRASTVEFNNDQLKLLRDVTEESMEILGGVRDQASYNRGRAMAAAMYRSYGLDPSSLQLPNEYSPELIEELRMQGMSTREQLQSVLQERKLDWDIEDDMTDNERADRNTDSLIETRDGRLSEYERNNRERLETTRRGQDVSSRDRRRGQDIKGSSSSKKRSARPTATDAKGNKVEWNGKAWVPVK